MKNLFANIAAKQLYCNSVFDTIKKQIWAVSSAGSERLPYKQDVGGSNPSLPTKTSLKRGFFSYKLSVLQKWRNRQTRWTQNPVDLTSVWVRLPPSAQKRLEILYFKPFLFLYFR